jgi:hypothetical protein
VLPGKMAIGDAPARYPLLWNAGRKDHTQWGGWAANGNDGLAVARDLGQVLGVFAKFYPGPKCATDVLDRDYLGLYRYEVAPNTNVNDRLISASGLAAGHISEHVSTSGEAIT